MKSIALFYGHVASNVGDIAINRGQMAMLRQTYPEAIIHVVLLNARRSAYRDRSLGSFDPDEKIKFIDVRAPLADAVSYAVAPRLWLDKCGVGSVDLVVLAAGEHLFSYADNDNFSGLFWRTLPAFAAQQAGKPCVMMPSTFGPFETKQARDLIGALLKSGVRIAARETRSLNQLLSLDAPETTQALLDPAFFIAPPKKTARPKQRTIGLVMRSETWGIRLAPAERNNFTSGAPEGRDTDKAFRFSLELCRKLLTDSACAIRFLVQTDADQALAEAVADELGQLAAGRRFKVARPETVDDYLDALQGVDMVVASRFHALILGMVCGKPGLGVYFDTHGHKIPGLMDLLGRPDDCFKLTPSSLLDAVEAAFLRCVSQTKHAAFPARRIDKLHKSTWNWMLSKAQAINRLGESPSLMSRALLNLAALVQSTDSNIDAEQAVKNKRQLEEALAHIDAEEAELRRRDAERNTKSTRQSDAVRARNEGRIGVFSRRLKRLGNSTIPKIRRELELVARSPRHLLRLPSALWRISKDARTRLGASKLKPRISGSITARRERASNRIELIRFMRQRSAQKAAPRIAAKGILYLLHNSLPFHTGGYAMRTHGLLSGFRDAGWDVIAQARPGYPYDRTKTITEPVPASRLVDGIEYRFLPDVGHIDQQNQVRYVEQYAEAVLNSIDASRIGYVQAPSFFQNGFAGRLIADRLGVPLVYEMRGLEWFTNGSLDPVWQHRMHGIVGREVELEAARLADYVFAITGALKDWLVANGLPENKISILPNGSSGNDVPRILTRDNALVDSLGLNGAFVVGYVGSVVFYEGIDLIVKAVGDARERTGLNIRFLLVGDGRDSERIANYIQKSGAQHFVSQVGRVQHNEVDRFYDLIDAFVMARTDLEICQIISPLKPLEAMTKGKLLITSDVAAIREMVDASDGGALTFSAGSYQELSQRIVEAAENPAAMAEIASKGRDWSLSQRAWGTLAAKALSDVEKRFGFKRGRKAKTKLSSLENQIGKTREQDKQMPLAANLVELAGVPNHPYLQTIMDNKVRKRFQPYDAQRVSYAFAKAIGGDTCLEVGPGRCDLTNMVFRAGLYGQMTVIDIEDRSRKMPEGVDFRVMNVGALEFEDNSFDSVFCMEVLEHLDDATFESALAEIRRVCRGQLLITVPFLEPMPSKFHLQKFTEARVRELFPSAQISLLLKEPVTRVPWLMVEENHNEAGNS